jgi:hypothetical protein
MPEQRTASGYCCCSTQGCRQRSPSTHCVPNRQETGVGSAALQQMQYPPTSDAVCCTSLLQWQRPARRNLPRPRQSTLQPPHTRPQPGAEMQTQCKAMRCAVHTFVSTQLCRQPLQSKTASRYDLQCLYCMRNSSMRNYNVSRKTLCMSTCCHESPH